MKDFITHNQKVWDNQARANVAWSQPVSSEQVENAKKGIWELYILPTPIDKDWIGDVKGKKYCVSLLLVDSKGPY
ncbi:hypothetical protein QNH98_00350 [Myroides sp. mNGS23_01]|nr:hypothetical protein [Myroides sp. mNGS23_01]WHT39215.1 hypothetical protein QNH98_00350 [Myroides sp. mNGS23_01]